MEIRALLRQLLGQVDPRDPFVLAYRQFEKIVTNVANGSDVRLHGDIENELERESRTLNRLIYQAHFDAVSAEELRGARAAPQSSDGAEPRQSGRQVESLFGTVTLRRLGYGAKGGGRTFPLDAKLGLPEEKYSHPLQRRAVEEARVQSMAGASSRLDETTGGHLPKRQVEEAVVRAAADFDAFYLERPAPSANDASPDAPAPLLVMSTDATGILVVNEALRDATRKDREQADADPVRGDPFAPLKLRRFSKRMAQVTGVWDQARYQRTPQDIILRMRDRAAPPERNRPRPKNKRLTASIVESARDRIVEMFDEADRRDPERTREVVVLVDGLAHPIEVIREEAAKRGRSITIVVDLLHVLHYLWGAGNALCSKDPVLAEAWVTDYLEKLLTRPLTHVIAGMRRSATMRELTGTALTAVEACAKYLLGVADYVKYGEFLARGLPVATGVIEGACRHLAHDRMDITGARWDLPSAEAMLRIRALNTNGDWNEYWAFHQRKVHERLYGYAGTAREAA